MLPDAARLSFKAHGGFLKLLVPGFLNPVKMPRLKAVECTIDLLPERRIATIDSGWTPSTEVEPGAEIPLKVFLRSFRGERFETVKVKIPAGMPKGGPPHSVQRRRNPEPNSNRRR
jgi:hypothetical protein